MDSRLAVIRSCASGGDFLACEISQGAAVVFDSALWLAFLGRVRRTRVVAGDTGCLILPNADEEGAMKSAFRKLSRVRTLGGSTTWYLSDDCLLAAKRLMYSVEYRRFYLRDLESVVIWPTRLWLLRLIIPAVLFAALGLLFWEWVNSTAGAIIGGVGALWVLLELAAGPTAQSRIRFTGSTIDLPLVMRKRRAAKVLARIDAAVRATRAVNHPPSSPSAAAQTGEASVSATSQTAETPSPIAATQTNAS